MATNPNAPVRNPHFYPKCSVVTTFYPSLASSTTAADSNPKSPDVEANMAESLISSDPNSRPKHFRNTFEECIFVFIIMMSAASTTFLQGVTVINTATVGRALNMTPAEVTWISAALGLSSGSFMLFFGKTADLLGRKLQLLLGLAFLSACALVTAFAPNGIALNVLCGFLGLGTAAISPPAIGLLFTTYPEGRRRNKATGALGCGNPIGFLLGSISSGVATRYFSWRASFIFISIFFFLMTILAFWTMPSFPRSGNFRIVARRFDYLGTVLTIMGTGLLSAALTEGPEEGYQSLKVILMLILGVFCLFGFAIWENIYTYPLLDPKIWRNRNFSLCILCVLFGYMSFITNQFWISLYMQNVQHLSSLHIAVRLIPQVIAGILWSYGGQLLISRVSGTIIMGIGAFAYLTGATLVYFTRQISSYWAFLFPALCITVMGADFQFIIANLYVNTQMSDQSSLGAGVLQTAMRLSISLGLAITAAVYGSSYETTKGLADVNYAYKRAYFCSILFAVIGILFVPFMQIGRQGNNSKTKDADSGEMAEDRPRSAGEYSDRNSGENKDEDQHHHNGRRLGQQPGRSTSSVSTLASTESAGTFFPRWSWENEKDWKDKRYRESNVVYEVCIKCLEERRVVLRESSICEGGRDRLPGERRHRRRECDIYSHGRQELPHERRQELREGNMMSGGAGWL